jgi:superfamily I DNA and/or RNA helicase
MGGRSKSNEEQVKLVARILPKLKLESKNDSNDLQVTILTPYTKQAQALKSLSTPCFTIDSFQGRESDIIIFSTVRCNTEREIGFVEDPRRLNVMWTRARLALIIIGDRETMTANSALWKRAIESCKVADISSLDSD